MMSKRTEHIFKAADDAAFLVGELSDCCAGEDRAAYGIVFRGLLNLATEILGTLNTLRDEALKQEGESNG
jgi:hypothetical protein